MKSVDFDQLVSHSDIFLKDIIDGGIACISLSDGKFLYASECLFDLTGYSKEDMSSELVYTDLIYPEDRKFVTNKAAGQMKESGKAQVVYRILKKDGSPLWIKCYASTISCETGPVAIGLFVGYSEEKRVELETARISKEMASIVEAIPGGVAKMVLNDDFRVLFASDKYYELTGYTKKEFYDAPIYGKGRNLVVEEDLPGLQSVVSELLENGNPCRAVYRVRKKDGSIAWNTAYCSGYEKIGDDYIIQGIFIDTTAIKAVEASLLNITNTIPGGILQVGLEEDGSPVIEYASEGFYRLTGYSMEEYAAEDFKLADSPSIHPEDKKILMDRINQFIENNKKEDLLDYRSVHKDGSIRWIRINGIKLPEEYGKSLGFMCILTDITESKAAEQKAKLDEERYRIICEQTQDIVFDWNMETVSIYHSPTFENKFGYKLPVENTLEFLCQSDTVYSDDLHKLVELTERLKNGQAYGEAEYRIRTNKGKFIWCRIRGTAIFDENNKAFRAVGTISDISEYKKQHDALKEQAEKDLLTGIYNKMTGQKQIDTYLEYSDPQQTHGLLMIDIDDFKFVNDNYGHAIGDALLTECARLICSCLREEDIVVRIGGDEFVVLLKNVKYDENIRQKAESIIELFRKRLKNEEAGKSITCSIEISIFPKDGYGFQELYEKADAALYFAKGKGKNTFSLFSEQCCSGLRNKTPGPGKIESAEYSGHNFVSSVFEKLYDETDTDKGINSVLENIARYLRVDRVYIYETAEGDKFIKSFEYSEKGRTLPYNYPLYSRKNIRSYLEKCDENGVLFCPNTNLLSSDMKEAFQENDIFFILQVPIMDKGEFKGLVGFSRSKSDISFSDTTAKTGILLAKILSVYLRKR